MAFLGIRVIPRNSTKPNMRGATADLTIKIVGLITGLDNQSQPHAEQIKNQDALIKQLSPNPILRGSTYNIDLSGSIISEIDVTSITGQRLDGFSLTFNGDDGLASIQVGTQVIPGMYMISLTVDGKPYTQKIIVE